MSDYIKIETELAQLRALRDEVRIRAHLAKMDAKDKWHELEPKVNEIIGSLEKLRDSL